MKKELDIKCIKGLILYQLRFWVFFFYCCISSFLPVDIDFQAKKSNEHCSLVPILSSEV